ncbi:MAG: energy-coupling factor transporter transmembrane component T family protein [Syntrophomonadaceae bacterium]|jgi:energy-coupling factor transport system permease protein
MKPDFCTRSIVVYLLVWFLVALLKNDLFILLIMLLGIGVWNWKLDRLKRAVGLLKWVLPLSFIIVIINSLFNSYGTAPWLELGRYVIYREPFLYGISMAIKLLLILQVFTVFNILIPPEKYFDLFGSTAAPGIIMTGIAIRLIPELVSRARAIREIQEYRGYNAHTKGLAGRCKILGELFLNLMRSSLNGAVSMAEAMWVRAYGTGPRTCYHLQQWTVGDNLLVIGSVLALVGALWGETNYILGALGFYKAMVDFTWLIVLLLPIVIWKGKEFIKLEKGVLN